MSVLRLAELPAGLGPTAVTVGKFDGVHTGHLELLRTTVRLAAERGLTPAAITFDRNPRTLFDPGASTGDLLPLGRRLELLQAEGLAAVVVAEFDAEFAASTPAEFVQRVLADGLDARVVVVGRDFRFGAKGAGTTQTLRELGEAHGFEVVIADDVCATDGERVSSTRIREALDAGDVAVASHLLGRLPSVRAEVVHGQQRGRTLGYPTANLSRAVEGRIPADGVYAAWLLIDGRRYGSAVSIGNNPTFEGVPEQQIEAHAFDQSFDLYGRMVEVEFVARIRGMRKFPDAAALATQMAADEQAIRELLGVPRA